MTMPNTHRLALALLSAILFALMLWPFVAHGEDRGAWFQSLRQPDNGGSCCDVADCHRTDAEYRKDGWWAVIQGVMRKVPPEKVLHDRHYCPSRIVTGIRTERPNRP